MRTIRRGPAASDVAEDAALAAIVRSSQDAVIAKTVDGTVTSWNRGAEQLYGWPAGEMLGASIELTIPREAIEAERARHRRVAGGAAESGYRCTRVRSDGRPIDVVMSMSPVCDDRGRVTGVASISRSLTASEHAEALYASLLEAAPDAIVCVGPDGTITTVNTETGTMFGYAREELLGQPLEILLPEDVRAQHRGHQERFQRDPRRRSMGAGLSLQARRRDGSTFPVEISLAPDLSQPGSVIAAVRDVTDARAGEAVVRESELRLRQIADGAAISFMLYQLHPPDFLYVSPGVSQTLGLTAEEIASTGGLTLDLLHPDDRERVERDYFHASRAGLPARSEHRIVTPAGTVHWIRATSNPVPDASGRPLRTVITLEDISDDALAVAGLKDAETAARAANDAKNHFLSRMSHELRTPLNAVLGFGQLLEAPLAGTEHAAAIGHILSGGWHLLELINDVLDITRIESGEISVSVEQVPAAPLVREAVSLMQPIADTAGVNLVVSDGPDCHVLADRQRMRQVLLNLLSNAIKYNRLPGTVTVGWTTAADGVAIAVRDDGPGIPERLRSRLFTPFDRLGAEATGIDGSGIGLALTKSLVDLMNGSIAVESSVPGGSCFTVTLPAAPSPVPTARKALPAEQHAAHAIGSEATVLYIEDNQPNVLVLEEILRRRPRWRLIHAGLGALGVELARAHRPDLILLDLHLPDIHGRDVLLALRQIPTASETPIVVLTADATPSNSRQLIDAGANRYLTKPIRLDQILGLLDDIACERDQAHA